MNHTINEKLEAIKGLLSEKKETNYAVVSKAAFDKAVVGLTSVAKAAGEKTAGTPPEWELIAAIAKSAVKDANRGIAAAKKMRAQLAAKKV